MLTSYYEVLCLREQKEKEEQRRWNRARWSVFNIIWKIPGKKTNWPRSVERMFPFPWDVKMKPVQIDCTVTADEQAAFEEIFNNYKAQKNGIPG